MKCRGDDGREEGFVARVTVVVGRDGCEVARAARGRVLDAGEEGAGGGREVDDGGVGEEGEELGF